MKRFMLGALIFGCGVALAAEPVSVYPPTLTSAPASLNQSLPQVLSQSAPAMSAAPTMTSSPTWAPTATSCATPTYLNCGKPACDARSCEPKYTAMPGCSAGPSLTRPYLNLLQPPRWLNRCDDGTCNRGNLLDRLQAWLSISRSGHDAPGFSAHAFQAPLRTYFPYQSTAGCASCATGPVEGGRVRTVYIPLVNRCDAMPNCNTAGVIARPNLFHRMMGFFTPEGFGFSSGQSSRYDQGECSTGTCAGLGSSCTSGRVRYANPMTHGTASIPSTHTMPTAPISYPGTLVPMSPLPTTMPTVIPSGYSKPLKSTLATQPLTNP